MKRMLYIIGDFIQKIIIKNLLLFITLGFIKWIVLYCSDFEKLLNIFTSYVIPLSVGYTTGNMIDKKHGGASGIIGTALIIYGALTDNILEIILMSFLVSYTVKIFKEKILSKITPGFEMFAINIFVPLSAFVYYFIFLKIIPFINIFFHTGNDFIMRIGHGFSGIVILTFLIEISKVFFINNFINHGFLTLAGYGEIFIKGNSIFFLLETNPGPGLGVLLAVYLFAKEKRKNIASNIVIEFFGGIHEMYFPYILKNMKLIWTVICGGLAGNLFFYFFNITLTGVPSPGSVITIAAFSAVPRIYILSGIFLSTAVSFCVGYVILFHEKSKIKYADKKETVSFETVKSVDSNIFNSFENREIIVISILCSGGMGSSHIGKNLLQKLLNEKGLKNIKVYNSFVGDKTIKSNIIITHNNLKDKTQNIYPESVIIGIDDYADKDFYKNFINKYFQKIKKENKIEINIGLQSILKKEVIENINQNMGTDLNKPFSIGDRILVFSKVEESLLDKIIINHYPYGIKDDEETDKFLVVGITTNNPKKYKKIIKNITEISKNLNIMSELEISDNREYFSEIFNFENIFKDFSEGGTHA